MTTCVCLGEALARYGFGPTHPFGNDRIYAFEKEFRTRALDERVRILDPVMGSREQLALFHQPGYLEFLEKASRQGQGLLDAGDTPAFAGIWEASLTVAGTVCAAADRLLQSLCKHAMVPIAGLHHARRDGAAGFCAINDCGIVIEHLKESWGLERIGYVDIDAHHGDGVYYAFETDPAVIIVDFHEDGRYLYPGTGAVTETGRGPAAGTKMNIPLPPGAKDELFLKLWPKALEFLERSGLQFCILQAGADSLAGDPITHLQLSSRVHARVAGDLAALGCPLLVLGGGGYNRDNLAQAWTGILEALVEDS